jgi:hypothetical protein
MLVVEGCLEGGWMLVVEGCSMLVESGVQPYTSKGSDWVGRQLSKVPLVGERPHKTSQDPTGPHMTTQDCCWTECTNESGTLVPVCVYTLNTWSHEQKLSMKRRFETCYAVHLPTRSRSKRL